jgi:hypothetical protein
MTCEHCGTEFAPRRRRKDTRFCRTGCRAAWHAAQRAARLGELERLLAQAVALVRELQEGRR